jgi:hypothetical protein
MESFGGWGSWCEMANTNSPTFWVPTFEKLYRAFAGNESDAAVEVIRLEYQAAKRALPPPVESLDEPALEMVEYREPSRAEVAQIWKRIDQIEKGAVPIPVKK